MSHLGVGSAWWLVVLAAVAWPAAHLAGHGPLPVAFGVPLLFGLGVLLVRRLPVAGGLLVCTAQSTSLLAGVPTDSPAGLLPALTILVVLGLTVPLRVALPMVVLHLAVVVATGLGPVRTLVGIGLFGATWLLAHQVARRRRLLAETRTRLDALVARDAGALAEQRAAEERRRLVARSASVVRAALTDVRRTAALAAVDLDPHLVAATRQRAVAAVDELRGLLGLVDPLAGTRDAATAAPEPSTAAPDRSTGVARGLLRDLGLALGLVAVGFADLHVDALDASPAAYLLTSLLAATLALRSRPLLAVAAATGVMLAALGLSVPMGHGVAESAVLGLLTWSVVGSGGRLALACWAALLLATAAVAQQRASGYPEVMVALMAVVALTAWARARAEADQGAVAARAEELGRQVDAVVGESLAEGRARLARDLHDVVGHAVGVMVLQAGAAVALREQDPARARAALAEVAATGDDALVELVALDGGPHTRAVPFAEGVDTLVERIRRAGLRVAPTGRLELPPGPVATALHHVVQEGLTNAARHAPGAAVRLELLQDADLLEVTVTNGPGTAPGPVTTSGTGLLGLRARLDAVGGRLTTGATPDGGFRLRAWVPLVVEPAALPAAAEGVPAAGTAP